MPVSLEWLYGQYSAHNNVVERFLACARTRLPLSIYIYIYIYRMDFQSSRYFLLIIEKRRALMR